MRLSAAKIAEIINGIVVGNPDAVCEGVAPVESASPTDAAFVYDSKYEKKIPETRASVIIASKDYGIASKTFVIVPAPLVAFATLLEYIENEERLAGGINSVKGIHPSAVVSEKAVLGKDVTVGPCAVIEAGAHIGDGSYIGAGSFIGEGSSVGNFCVIHPNVVIYNRCVLGNKVVVHSSSVIGSDGFGYIPGAAAGGGIKKIPQLGIVKIADEVEIGSNVSIDRATLGETFIDGGTKIDNLCHIAHNVRIGKRCLIAANAGIAGSVVIGDDVMMGGQVGVKDHVTIGNRAVIAARAGVIGDVPEGATVSGFPARPHSAMMRLYALMDKLPEIFERIKKLESR